MSEKSAHEEKIDDVKKRLKHTGGVIEPWMYNVLFPMDLRRIWASGDWITETSEGES